jgi:hypothetical protein
VEYRDSESTVYWDNELSKDIIKAAEEFNIFSIIGDDVPLKV